MRVCAALVLSLLAVALLAPTAVLAAPAGPAVTGPAPATVPDGKPGLVPPAVTPLPKTSPAAAPAVSTGPSVADFAKGVFEGSLVVLVGGVDDLLRGVVNGVSGGGNDFIRSTPAAMTYANPTLRILWSATAGIAGAFLAALLIWSGLCITVAPMLRMTHEEALLLLPRTALGAAMLAGSLWLGSRLIDLNNAAAGLIGVVLPAWDATLGANPTFPDVLARLLYLVAAIVLLLQFLMRIAKLDVLLVLSPLAWLCWVAPQTRGWFSLWARQFVGTVFTQFVQLVALKLGASIIGFGGGQGTLTPLFLGMAILWFTYKIPGLMEGYAGTGWLTALAVTRLVQTGVGVVSGGGSTAATAAGATAAKTVQAGQAVERALPTDLWRGGTPQA